MSEKNEILVNADYWLQLSERYFEADTSQEEEMALMRFVASDYPESDAFDDNAKAVFQEVRAAMSFLAVGRAASMPNNEKASDKVIPLREKTENKKLKHVWKWAAGAAAVIALAFFLRSVFALGDSGDLNNVCVAYNNGTMITDKDEVLAMMRDSWDDIDIQTSSVDAVESQLREMFDVLE